MLTHTVHPGSACTKSACAPEGEPGQRPVHTHRERPRAAAARESIDARCILPLRNPFPFFGNYSAPLAGPPCRFRSQRRPFASTATGRNNQKITTLLISPGDIEKSSLSDVGGFFWGSGWMSCMRKIKGFSGLNIYVFFRSVIVG